MEINVEITMKYIGVSTVYNQMKANNKKKLVMPQSIYQMMKGTSLNCPKPSCTKLDSHAQPNEWC